MSVKVLQVFYRGCSAALNLIVDEQWGKKLLDQWDVNPALTLTGTTVDGAPFVIRGNEVMGMILLTPPPDVLSKIEGPKPLPRGPLFPAPSRS